MPIYEYACAECKIKFEMHRSISDDSIPPCPSCKASKVKKLISQTAFQLKGSGWYKDGYGSTTPSSAASTESKSEKVSDPSAPNVSSDKPATQAQSSPAIESSSKKETVGS